MNKTIGLYNCDKKSGKTVSAVYLAESFATLGFKTLLIEADPKNQLSAFLGLKTAQSTLTFHDFFREETQKDIVVYKLNSASWSCIPYASAHSGQGLYRDENDLDVQRLEKIRAQFDYVFIDFPSRAYQAPNALFKKVDSVIVPVESEYYGLDTLDKTFEYLITIQDVLIEGILLNRYDTNNSFSTTLVAKMKEIFSDLVFESMIPRNYYLGLPDCSFEALLNKTTHFGVADYLKLANEIIEKQSVTES